MRRSSYSGIEWGSDRVLRGIPIARKALPLTLFPAYREMVVMGRSLTKVEAADVGKHLVLLTGKSPDITSLAELGEDLIAFHDDLVAQIYRLEFS